MKFDWRPNESTTDWIFFFYTPHSGLHIQGWTIGGSCHEARGVEKLCGTEFFSNFVFIPRAHSGSKKRDSFSILYIPPISHLVGTLPFHNYIPDSPSQHFLFVFSPHDGWPDGKMEQRGGSEMICCGRRLRATRKAHRGGNTTGCRRRVAQG